MLDKKHKLFRIMEKYMNEFQGDYVREMYGNGASIKIHSMTHSFSTKSVLFELVIILGETINESVMDKSLAEVLIRNISLYFFPNQQIKTYVRFDV